MLLMPTGWNLLAVLFLRLEIKSIKRTRGFSQEWTQHVDIGTIQCKETTTHSFQLFLLLGSFMLAEASLNCLKFKQHQLQSFKGSVMLIATRNGFLNQNPKELLRMHIKNPNNPKTNQPPTFRVSLKQMKG